MNLATQKRFNKFNTDQKIFSIFIKVLCVHFFNRRNKTKDWSESIRNGRKCSYWVLFFFVLLFSDIIKSSRNERILEVSNTFSIEQMFIKGAVLSHYVLGFVCTYVIWPRFYLTVSYTGKCCSVYFQRNVSTSFELDENAKRKRQ